MKRKEKNIGTPNTVTHVYVLEDLDPSKPFRSRISSDTNKIKNYIMTAWMAFPTLRIYDTFEGDVETQRIFLNDVLFQR